MEDHWQLIGDAMSPALSLVATRSYWWTAGTLLALVVLMEESVHPVSPAIIYALLSNVHGEEHPENSMNLSLRFIRELQESKAEILLPWMMIPPNTDWRNLKPGHNNEIQSLLCNLGLPVRSSHLLIISMRVTMPAQAWKYATKDHVDWTSSVITSVLFGDPSIFSSPQFGEMSLGFRACIKEDTELFKVYPHTAQNLAAADSIDQRPVKHSGLSHQLLQNNPGPLSATSAMCGHGRSSYSNVVLSSKKTSMSRR
jgi:hypothetical protein